MRDTADGNGTGCFLIEVAGDVEMKMWVTENARSKS